MKVTVTLRNAEGESVDYVHCRSERDIDMAYAVTQVLADRSRTIPTSIRPTVTSITIDLEN